ncbi:MAG TPA: DUF6186 family protein [Acidimicrobiales bacterium]|nr:DUF6186 family protein [Acidimicrobiales bacterium]
MSGRHAILVVWGLLGAGVVLAQTAALVSKGRFPGLGTVVRRLTYRPVGRSLLVLAWMWLGWHAFAR